MADVIDLLKFADENKPVDFADAFNQLMGQRVLNILDVAKQGIASSVFNGEGEVETSDVDNGETYEDS
jgi:hypothetical protein